MTSPKTGCRFRRMGTMGLWSATTKLMKLNQVQNEFLTEYKRLKGLWVNLLCHVSTRHNIKQWPKETKLKKHNEVQNEFLTKVSSGAGAGPGKVEKGQTSRSATSDVTYAAWSSKDMWKFIVHAGVIFISMAPSGIWIQTANESESTSTKGVASSLTTRMGSKPPPHHRSTKDMEATEPLDVEISVAPPPDANHSVPFPDNQSDATLEAPGGLKYLGRRLFNTGSTPTGSIYQSLTKQEEIKKRAESVRREMDDSSRDD
ncbi:hypothetical protein B0H13DRAFT_1851522 [Mycena leptocephala]|nr:hypothetical protein B0H13DRAFT_1851522 [Mycena leptocephala]